MLSAKESLRGERDDTLLERAVAEQRVLLTLDKDFGELAWRSRLPAMCGIVLFRFAGRSPETDSNRMVQSLQSRSDWPGHFSVVTETKIRMRRLPTT